MLRWNSLRHSTPGLGSTMTKLAVFVSAFVFRVALLRISPRREALSVRKLASTSIGSRHEVRSRKHSS
ncbi:hypothetical protein N658DRAFT_492749 [Parathielavia hyrcaniae]|uniref:Uncharacterized protein n=1 Tax=Parathielavia hyrcaniae TaxID=113614 RepID=A0AAN6QCC5_9PEZI|nr:hypothetical protein N658DRAFT_492749 [Parathielavia hyrcaniae]